MAKKKTTKTKRAAARVRGTAKRATGMGRTGKTGRRRKTARRRVMAAKPVRRTTSTRKRATARRSAPRRPRKNDDMMTAATKTLRRAADTAMGIATTAIKRVRPT